jgi:hypothetical protein
MDRTIVYPSSIPLDSDLLSAQRYAMNGLGMLMNGLYGSNTVAVGLPCTPTVPASMQVNVGQGAIVSLQTVDGSAFGSLPSDSSPLVKMGINLSSTVFTLTAPSTTGQSINYLIEATLTETDNTPVVLPYFNAANPSQPYSGPNNSGTPQNTKRAQIVSLQLKAGAAANAGTQATPAVDVGWTGLYVITVNFAQTSITNTSIATYPSAPFLAQFLQSHHGGVPGQAPKINLPTETQGILPAAQLPTLSGRLLNTRIFSTPGTSTYTPTSGTASVDVEVVGGGGSGGGTSATGASQVSAGAGGGGGGYARKRITSGFSGVTITVGAGGTAASAGGAGHAGGTSSFGALVSATGGSGGTLGSASAADTLPRGGVSGGAGSGGDINAVGGQTQAAWYTNPALSSPGGVSFFGAGGNGNSGTGTGGAALTWGSGSGGAVQSNPSAAAGASTPGAGGVVIVREYT